MELHPLAARFADVATAYERGRPEYAPAAVGALAAELGLPAGARVLDLAAGTGKLTRALLRAGFDVVAVEPQAPLRDVLAASIGAERVRDGVAEAIPLPDASVAAVTVADAFHWFDRAAALTEIRRVLRPGGGVAVISTAPDWSDASWAPEFGSLMESLLPEHPHFHGPPWHDAVRADGHWGEPREIRVTTTQPSDPERIVDWVASMSWIAAMGDEQRSEVLARIDGLVRDGTTPAQMRVHVTLGLASLA